MSYRCRIATSVSVIILVLVQILLYQNCSMRALSVDQLRASSNPETANPTPTPAEAPADFYSLYVARSGSGRVTSNPVGIDCGADCSQYFDKKISVTLTATSSEGSVFKGWGGACSGTNPTCVVPMSKAQNVNVSFESTQPIGSIASLIASMPSNSWKSLPGTLMKDACPTPYSSYVCEAVILAWSGGAYDETRDRMVVIGGGHGDSWYNNVFAFDLNQLEWQRLSEMPGDFGKAPPAEWKDIRLETCGYYPKLGLGGLNIPTDVLWSYNNQYVDPAKCFTEPILSQLDFQQPRSTHSYGRVYIDRINDQYCYIPLGTYPSAQAATKVVNCFSPTTGRWTRVADRPDNVGGRGQVALDSKGNLWSVTDGSGVIGEFDLGANTWKTYGSLNSEAGGGTDIDRKRNHLYVAYPVNNGATYSLRRFDLNSAASLNTRPLYVEVATTGEAPTNKGMRPGLVYSDAKDLFYLWGSGRDVYVFDPARSSWTRASATGDDPGMQQTNGTYGRFRYSPRYDVFVLVNSTTQNVFIYKP